MRQERSINQPASHALKLQAKAQQPQRLLSRFAAASIRQIRERRLVRYGLLASNVLILAAIAVFVLRGSSSSVTAEANLQSAAQTSGVATNPLDNLSSADIAVGLARMTSLPELTAVTNQADSVKAEMAVSPADNTVVGKPQQVVTALKSRKDIKTYVAADGDTMASIAGKFGVTSDSIMWSNGLNGNGVAAGTRLLIPPVNGIVYTVKGGDTVDSLAQKYHTDKNKIIAYNDAEISGIQTGEQIIIPDAQQSTTQAAAAIVYGVAYGGSASYGGSGSCFYQGHGYPGYGYDCGYCTWWVALRRAQAGNPVPSNLGNASSWGYLARSYGLSTGSTPQVGAAVVTSTRGAGHVAYVTAVNGDGTITVSEMNHLGWNVVDTQTMSGAGYTYIY